MYSPYEPGGIMGPNRSQLLSQLAGGDVQQPQVEPKPPAPPTAGAETKPPAFDPSQQVGHNGTINGLSREQYRDLWQGSGARSIGDLQNFLSQHGGVLQSGNGTVMTPFGEQIDMLQGARTNGNGSAAWGGVGSSGDSGPAPMSAPAAGGGMPSGIGGVLGGDPISALQQALGNIGADSGRYNIRALLNQLGAQ